VDASLFQAIRDAFPVGVAPAQPVTQHRCLECDEVEALLGGRVWLDVAKDFREYCHDTLVLLTPAARVYYLPAYMEYGLREPGMMAGHCVACALERGDLPREVFTPVQRAAIVRWIEVYYQDEPESKPPEGMMTYWRDSDPRNV
jgi:Family of unknown function (DUF6714)